MGKVCFYTNNTIPSSDFTGKKAAKLCSKTSSSRPNTRSTVVLIPSLMHLSHLVPDSNTKQSASMASKPTQPAEDIRQCPICQSEFADPRMLPCLHTLCTRCIEGLGSAPGQKVQCPSCSHEYEVPTEGVSGFPKNFFLSDVQELLQELKELKTTEVRLRPSGQRECDIAKRDNDAHGMATTFCVVCAEFYCETCTTLHNKFGGIRDHKLRPAADVDPTTVLAVKARQRNLKCGEHPDEKLRCYCDTCHIPVCTTCCLLTHKQHEYRAMVAVGKECQKNLQDFIKAADGHVNKVREQLKKLKAYPRIIQQDTNKACHEVKQAANEMRDLVTKREQYLLQQIQDIGQEALAEVSEAQEDTELKIATTESLLSYMQVLHDSGDVTDQVIHTPTVEKQLHQQQAAPLRTVEWSASVKTETNSVDTLNAVLGSLTKVKLGQPQNTLKTGGADHIVGLVVVNGCICAIHLCSFGLYIHNAATDLFTERKLDALRAIGLAAIHGIDNILVIPDSERQLHFVTVNKRNMEITRHSAKNMTFEPGRVSIHPITRQLIIADRTNQAIAVCDALGNLQNTVTVKTEVHHMWCAFGTDDGYVILDNSDPGRVHWVDSQGRVTHTYGNREGEGLNDPRHMVRTSWGQLVVADTRNHRLHLVDASGRLLCYLLTKDDGIHHPYCVWLDETTSLLYVGHHPAGHSEIRVYEWPSHRLQLTVGTHK